MSRCLSSNISLDHIKNNYDYVCVMLIFIDIYWYLLVLLIFSFYWYITDTDIYPPFQGYWYINDSTPPLIYHWYWYYPPRLFIRYHSGNVFKYDTIYFIFSLKYIWCTCIDNNIYTDNCICFVMFFFNMIQNHNDFNRFVIVN